MADPITVIVSADLGGAPKADFGIPLHATDDVGGGFPTLRLYSSPAEIKADADVNQATRDFLTDYGFAQRDQGGVSQIAIGKVDYVGFAADELDALVAAQQAAGFTFYGLDLSSLTQADVQIAAAWAESSEKLYVGQTADAAVLAGTGGNVAEVLAGFLYTRSALLYHGNLTARAALAWLCKKLGKDPDTPPSGKTSWRHATLAGVAVDILTSSESAAVEGNNANTYELRQGRNTTAKGVLCSSNPIDTRITRDWFKARATERLTDLIVAISNRNEALPYDQDGIDQAYGVVRSLLKEGEDLRHFQVGSSSLVKPDIRTIPAATRKTRKLTMNGRTIDAGSLEEIDLTIAVEF